MFLQVLIGLLTILLVWDYYKKKRKNEIIKDIPGPRAWPLFGNVFEFVHLDTESFMEFMKNQREQYGKLFRMWVFQQLVIISCDPKDLEVVLSSNQLITKDGLYDTLHPWLGTGLLMSTGKKWHTRRKIISPTFHFKILEHFTKIFDQQSAVLVEKLKEFSDGETPVNMFPFICLHALDIITETAMGTKIHAQTNPNLPYVKAVTNITGITSNRIIRAWQRNDLIFRLLCPTSSKLLNDSIRKAHQFTESVIEERRQTLKASLSTKNTIHNENDAEDLNQKNRMALLDVLLQSAVDGEPLSNADIREEVDTFMFEGHDTTTSAISFCLYLISRHAKVQKKIMEEIRQVIGDDINNPVGLRDLSELKYLECVIKETLRLYPSVPVIGRHFPNDVEINGKKLPGGISYNVTIYALLRDPKTFPDPLAFKPERFLNISEKANAYTYIPFSAGPRNCIGQKFAILEMKSTVSKILRNFELLPLGPEVKPIMELVLRSSTGAHVGLKPRLYK